MANWKVSKEVVEVFPHKNADNLEVILAGKSQFVSQKGLYTTGDVVIFAPEKSILTNSAMLESFGKYLSGAQKNRVKPAQLRGELSEGITWPTDEASLLVFGEENAAKIKAAPLGEDISELMGITKYEPPIPSNLQGMLKGIHLSGTKRPTNVSIYNHDAYQFGAFANKYFTPDTLVRVTEKVHGSLVSYTAVFEDDALIQEVVSSKGLLKQGIEILEDEVNTYWKGVKSSKLQEAAVDVLNEYYEQTGEKSCIVNITGEVVPVQNGFSYGFTEPKVLVYSLTVNGVHIPYHNAVQSLKDVWVPVLFEGKLSDFNPYDFGDEKEHVSGKKLHITEGYVVSDENLQVKFRNEDRPVYLKIIAPKYAKKSNGEEIN